VPICANLVIVEILILLLYFCLKQSYMTFSEKIKAYNRALSLNLKLPEGIQAMNPYQDPSVLAVTDVFYDTFYNDTRPRHLIMGINPGRFGAGVTGIPFTDSVRLRENCQIHMEGIPETKELSSVFVYKMIEEYGGVRAFYGNFYINSVCPLGFTKINEKGRAVNYNYYDSNELAAILHDYIVQNIKTLLVMGFQNDRCYCLGTGKNAQFLTKLNAKHGFFQEIIPLEHPRFIMQYKSKLVDYYANDYVKKLGVG
jgi:hypothetical protein